MSEQKTGYIICLSLINNIQKILLQVAKASDINQAFTPPLCKFLNFFI